MTAHRHVSDEPGIPQKCVEISDQVCLTPFTDRDHLGGFLVQFDEGGQHYRAVGAVNVCADSSPRWEMRGSIGAGDLTLTPSIRISSPGIGEQLHGFVTNGKWVPA